MRDLLARAREELRHEPIEKRVRATTGDETIIDTTRALLLWEPRRICPIYAVPAEDIRAELEPAPAASDDDVPGLLHPGIPFRCTRRRASRCSFAGAAGYRLDDLPGYVAVDFEAFDWREEDEPVRGHPRDPYHRVDVCRSSRPLRIERDGEVVADSTRPGSSSRPGSRCASTSPARTSASRCRPARYGPTARTRARRPTGRSRAART